MINRERRSLGWRGWGGRGSRAAGEGEQGAARGHSGPPRAQHTRAAGTGARRARPRTSLRRHAALATLLLANWVQLQPGCPGAPVTVQCRARPAARSFTPPGSCSGPRAGGKRLLPLGNWISPGTRVHFRYPVPRPFRGQMTTVGSPLGPVLPQGSRRGQVGSMPGRGVAPGALGSGLCMRPPPRVPRTPCRRLPGGAHPFPSNGGKHYV